MQTRSHGPFFKSWYKIPTPVTKPTIEVKKIIFSPPCTIIIWQDNTKTIVRTNPDDEYDPHVGVAMCFMKRVCGESFYVDGPIVDGERTKIKAEPFHRIFRKWVDPWIEEQRKKYEDSVSFAKIWPKFFVTNEEVKKKEETK